MESCSFWRLDNHIITTYPVSISLLVCRWQVLAYAFFSDQQFSRDLVRSGMFPSDEQLQPFMDVIGNTVRFNLIKTNVDLFASLLSCSSWWNLGSLENDAVQQEAIAINQQWSGHPGMFVEEVPGPGAIDLSVFARVWMDAFVLSGVPV